MQHAYLNNYPQIQNSNFIAPSADLIGSVSLGEDSSIFFNCTVRADINRIEIGSETNIQDNSVLHVSDDFGVVIGNRVSVGHNATLHACTLGNSILVGMGAIIMDGTEIGDRSIVAAGCLVPKDKKFEPESLIVGSPARRIRRLESREIEYIDYLAQKYVKVKNNYLKNSQ